MSRTVDERVVEMRFDNENFEKNAQKSLSTLEKLENALKFKGASEGLKNVDAAARSVNMSGLESSAERVRLKFSALEVIGVTALANITNKAVNAAEALTRSLTIDQVTAGWTKYADKTAAVQTIMAATANQFSNQVEQMEEVNAQLEKLSWFTDETSYNFVDMVSNIGKFTSNNISLEESVTSMQGIATWAAISGANSQAASRAMYNLSQAIGMGVLTTKDWMSIENANMATAEFKQTAIETAVELGKLKKVGDDLYQTIDGDEVSIAKFRDSLQKKWFTNDVLTATLDRYGKFTTKLNAAFNETGKQTTELLKDIEAYKDGTINLEDAVIGSEVSMERYGEILKELGDDSLDFGRKAFQAAQETKTFAEVIDYTKDAVSSQWMGIFEAIFGDYVNAKKLWTAISEDFYTLFVEPLENVKYLIQDSFGSTAWQLAWKGVADGVEEGLEDTEKLGDALKEMVHISSLMAPAFKDFTKNAKDADEETLKLIAHLEKPTGRELFTESIQNGLQIIIKAIQIVKDSWHDVFPPATAEQIYHFLEVINNFTNKTLSKLDENTDKIGRTLKGIFSVFHLVTSTIKGAFRTAIRLVNTVLGKFDLNIWDITAAIGDWLVHIHDVILGNEEMSGVLDRVIGVIARAIEIVVKFAKQMGLVDKAKLTFEKFVNKVKEVYSKVSQYFDGLGENIEKFISHWKELDHLDLTAVGNILKDFAETVLKPIFESIIPSEDTVAGKLSAAYKGAISKINITSTDVKNSPFITSVINGLKNLKDKLLEDVTLSDVFAGVIIGTDIFAVKKIVGLLDSFSGIGESLTKVFKNLAGTISKVGGYFKALRTAINAKTVLYVAEAIGILVAALVALAYLPAEKLEQGLNYLRHLAVILALLMLAVGRMNKLSVGAAGINAIALLGLGIAIAIVAKVVKDLSKLSLEESANGAIALVEICAILLLFLKGLSLLSAKGFNLKEMTGLLGLIGVAVSLRIIVDSIAVLQEKLKNIDMDQLGNQLRALGHIMVMLTLLSLPWLKTGKGAASAGLGMLGAVAALYLLTLAIDKILDLDVEAIRDKLNNFLAIFILFGIVMVMSRLAGENAAKGGAGILMMSVAILILVEAIKLIANISNHDLTKGLFAISVMMIIMGMVVAMSQFSGENAVKAGIMLILMSVALGIIAGSMYLLSILAKDEEVFKRVLNAIKWIGFIMIGLLAVSKFGTVTKESLVALGILIAVVGMIAASLYILATIEDQSALERATTAMAIVMAMFALMELCSSVVGKYDAAIGVMALMVAIVFALAGALAFIATLPVESTLPNAEALAILLGSFSLSMLLLSKIGPAASAAVPGIQAMALVLGEIGAVLLGIGWLVGQLVDPQEIQLIINTLTALGEALGGFFGGFVGKFISSGAEAISTSFINISKNLSTAIESLKPALDSLSDISGSTGFAEGIKAIGDMFLSFEKAGAWDAITNSKLFTKIFGEKDFESFAEGIKSLLSIFDNFEGIDENKADSLKKLSEIGMALTEFADSVPNKGGVWADIFGDNADLKTFGTQLQEFSKAINGAEDIDQTKKESLERLAEVGSTLARFADDVPNMGGILAVWIGDNADLKTFGENLKDFSKAIAAAETIDEDKKTSLDNLAIAGNSLVDFAKALDNAGINTYTTEGLNQFATDIVDFAKTLSGLTFNGEVNNSIGPLISSVDAIVTLAANLKENKKAVNKAIGNGGLKDLLGGIVDIVPDLEDVANAFSGKNFEATYTNLEGFTKAINLLITTVHSMTGEEGVYLSNLTESMKEFGANGITAIGTGLTEAANTMVAPAMSNAVNSIIKAATDKGSNFRKAGSNFIDKMKDGVTSNNSLKSTFTSKLENILVTIRNYRPRFYEAGQYLGDGYIMGIQSKVQSAYHAGYELGEASNKGVTDATDEQSPSEKARGFGNYFGEGYVIGIQEYWSAAYAAAEYMAKDSLTAMGKQLATVSRVINQNADFQPSISPVFDSSGLHSINSTLSNVKSAKLSASISGKVDANNVVIDYIDKLDAANSTRNHDVLDAFKQLSSDIYTLGDRIENLELRLDGKALVGGIVERTDRALGQRTIYKRRGV